MTAVTTSYNSKLHIHLQNLDQWVFLNLYLSETQAIYWIYDTAQRQLDTLTCAAG